VEWFGGRWAELEREGLGWYVFGFGLRLTPISDLNLTLKKIDAGHIRII